MGQSTTPTGPGQHGASPPRGLDGTPGSSFSTGRFGRMFRHLPSYDVADASLVDLGNGMVQPLEDGELDKPLGEADDDENTATLDSGELRLPAGYTYFGQFVDHDITFDPVSSLQRQNDPDALVDFRTPRFDLDNVYGRGPADQPFLYADDGIHLLLGLADPAGSPQGGPDLPRNTNGRAIIGDPRNDENLIVSQLQSTMFRFHNAVADRVATDHPNLSNDDRFKFTQKVVRWHYQWVVIHDFLKRLVGDDVVDDILNVEEYDVPTGSPPNTVPPLTNPVGRAEPKLRFYHYNNEPFMPLEFAVAAYRFGHSMIRPSYLINDVATTDPPVAGAARIPIFDQTGQPRTSLSGFRPLPAFWGVEWKFFLAGIGPPVDDLPQPSYKLDATLSHPLGALPGSVAMPEQIVAGFDPAIAQSLAVRNLVRGKRLDLPSGPDVARAMGIDPIAPDVLIPPALALNADPARDAASRAALAGREPLWYYVLKEAELYTNASHLGPVGGRIVAEVLIGLLAGDPLSYVNVEPNWKPDLPAATTGTFTLSDLVNLAIP
ncbi:peroxidase family protein [Baekduia alba]|uniref:peroxidase family protein n=1 Tax=Baekduia alba TaxID=2997333 RepID=UPI002340A231|nr:heme peroxidase family protein [Baekduia alba]